MNVTRLVARPELIKSPPTALVIAVPAGATDDMRPGTAHLVEHIVLRRCQDSNATWVINGLTSEGITMFECITTPKYLDAARTKLQAAVFSPLQVTSQEVESELKVIDIESCSERIDTAILGTTDTRAGITAFDVMDFHNRHYRMDTAQNVVVSGYTPFAHRLISPERTQEASLSPDNFHVRMHENLTQIVFTQKGRSSEGAALLLDLARRIDPIIARRLTLPSETGYKRLRVTRSGESLEVSIRLVVRPTLTALVLSIIGKLSPVSCYSWVRDCLYNQTRTIPYEWADPALQARWQAFWDISTDGGYIGLRYALEANPDRLQNIAYLTASQLKRTLVDAYV